MRVLFIGNSRLGDAILSTGLLNHFVYKKNIEITVICSPLTKAIFQNVPKIKNIIAFKKEKRAGHWIKAWMAIEKGPWDLVVDLRNTPFTWLIKSNKKIIYRTKSEKEHRVISLSKLIKEVKNPFNPKVFITKKNEEEANYFLSNIKKTTPILAVAPSTNWKRKNWPVENFAKLISKLVKKKGPLFNAYAIILGGKDDTIICKRLESLLKGINSLDLSNKLSVMGVAAAMRRCSFFVGNDSGLMHLSASIGIPTLGLFGPSKEILYRPWGPKTNFVRTPFSYEELVCVPNYNTNDESSLMISLEVEKVYYASMITLKL